MISIEYNSFFNKEGFLLDDAYDPFKKNRYIDYFIIHQTEYIRCQDADLRKRLPCDPKSTDISDPSR